MKEYFKHIEESIHWANLEVSKLTQNIMDIHGLSSRKVKCLLNNICNIDGATYLEIGVFRGSTFCSAIYGNNIKSIGIDNWSSPFLTPNHLKYQLSFLNKDKSIDPKTEFINNVKKYGKEGDVSVYRANYLDFDFTTLGDVDIVFYDGETKHHDRYKALMNIIPIMNKTSILIVDDFNWDVSSIYKALNDSIISTYHEITLLTTGEDSEDFWNGIGIFLIEKF